MRPYFVEILGTPEAGKTTAINKALTDLRNKNYKVLYVRESAEIVPEQLGKGSLEANVWMRLETLQSILIRFAEKPDIVIADRGIIDALFWNFLFFKKGDLSKEQLIACDEFFKKMNFMPDLILVFTATPDECIARRGGEGRLVTKKFIKDFNTSLIEFFNANFFPCIWINTTSVKPDIVANLVQSLIENFYNNHLSLSC